MNKLEKETVVSTARAAFTGGNRESQCLFMIHCPTNICSAAICWREKSMASFFLFFPFPQNIP